MDITLLHQAVARLYLINPSNTYLEKIEIDALSIEIDVLLNKTNVDETIAINDILLFYIKDDNTLINITLPNGSTVSTTSRDICKKIIGITKKYKNDESYLVSDFFTVIYSIITELNYNNDLPYKRGNYFNNSKKYGNTYNVLKRVIYNPQIVTPTTPTTPSGLGVGMV